MSGFMFYNLEFLRALAALRGPVLTAIMRFFTLFGEETVAIVVLCAIYWCGSKYLAYGIGVAYFTTGNVVQGLKIIFRIPRPWDLDPAFVAVEAERLKVLHSYSFPSGHTQGAAALFGTLGFAIKERGAKIACFVLVGLVGLSRMFVGVHTPLDVGTSLLLCLAAAWVAARLFCGQATRGMDATVTAAVALLAAALLVLALGLAASGTISHAYAADSCKQAGAAIGFVLGAFLERAFIRFETATKKLWHQLPKYFTGLAGALLIKEAMRPVFGLIGNDIAASTLRYFFMVFWVAAIYPLILKAFFARRQQSKAPQP